MVEKFISMTIILYKLVKWKISEKTILRFLIVELLLLILKDFNRFCLRFFIFELKNDAHLLLYY